MAVPTVDREPVRATTQVARLAHETDFTGWRDAARALRILGVPPEVVLWTVDAASVSQQLTCSGGFMAPRTFLELARRAVLHRSDERFDLLYRLLWRLKDTPDLMARRGDPDVSRAATLARDVDLAARQMRAFAGFRTVRDDAGPAKVAWFAPAHRVARETAPFFARRFAPARVSILTPDTCVHWDGRDFAVTPGIDPADAPGADALEAAWREEMRRVRPADAGPSRREIRAAIRANRDAPYDGQPRSVRTTPWAARSGKDG